MNKISLGSRFLATVLAVVMVLGMTPLSVAASTGAVQLTLNTAEILAALEGSPDTAVYTVDSVPTLTVQDEDGAVLDTYPDEQEAIHASFELDRRIGDFLESLTLPYEQENSVLVRMELMQALEGKLFVKTMYHKNGVAVIAVIDPASESLVVYAVNLGAGQLPVELVVRDQHDQVLDYDQVSALIHTASRRELTPGQLAACRGDAEVLDIVETVTEVEVDADTDADEPSEPSSRPEQPAPRDPASNNIPAEPQPPVNDEDEPDADPSDDQDDIETPQDAPADEVPAQADNGSEASGADAPAAQESQPAARESGGRAGGFQPHEPDPESSTESRRSTGGFEPKENEDAAAGTARGFFRLASLPLTIGGGSFDEPADDTQERPEPEAREEAPREEEETDPEPVAESDAGEDNQVDDPAPQDTDTDDNQNADDKPVTDPDLDDGNDADAATDRDGNTSSDSATPDDEQQPAAPAPADDEGQDNEDDEAPAVKLAYELVDISYIAIIAQEQAGSVDVDDYTVTVQVPGHAWAAVSIGLRDGEGLGSDFTVTFDPANNAQEIWTVPVNRGEKVRHPETAPTIPDDMVSFLGWYADGEDEPFDFDTRTITSDLRLTARYSADYLVSYRLYNPQNEGNVGKIIHTQTVAKNKTTTPYILTEKDLEEAPGGAVFSHWYEGDDADKAFDFSTGITANVTLTAKFSNSYSVIFFSEGTQVDPISVTIGSAITNMPANPTRSGYQFRHWSTTPGGAAYEQSTVLTGDLVLYAVWTPAEVEYTIVYWVEKPDFAGDDPGTAAANYVYDHSTTAKATAGTPVNDLSNNNWDTIAHAYFHLQTSNHDTVLGNGTTVINLYHRLTEYTFVFDLNPSSFRYTTMNFQGEHYSSANTEKYTFTARVGQNITDLWPSSANADFNDYYSSSGNTVTNSTFGGWRKNSYSTTLISRRITLTTDLLPSSGTTQTYKARWVNGSRYTVNYRFEQLLGETGQRHTNGRYYVLNSDYSQEYLSSSSSLSPKTIEGMSPTSTSSQSGKEKNFYYNRNRSALTFNLLPGGTFPAGALPSPGSYTPSGNGYSNVMYGEQLSYFMPSIDPTRTVDGVTYEFLGWYYDPEYHDPVDLDTDTMPNGNLVLYAKWVPTTYEVRFYDSSRADAGLITTGHLDDNGYVAFPDDLRDEIARLESEGRGAFLGWQWYIGAQLFDFNADIELHRDVTLYAKWQTDGLTITYDLGAGGGQTPVDSETYVLGVHATLAHPGAVTHPDNHVFVGWQVDGTGAVYYPGGTVKVTGNLTLRAKYVEPLQAATLTYHANMGDGSETRSVTVEKNTSIQLGDAATFTRTGYTLLGWDSNPDAASPTHAPGERYTVADSITLYAVWQSDAHTITFTAGENGKLIGQDGAPTDEIQFTVDPGAKWSAIPVPRPQAADGYYFAGWNEELPGADATVTADLRFVAQFKPQNVLTIQANDSDSQTYTGERISVTTEATLTGGQLEPGHRLVATASGSGINAGEYDITVDYDVYDGDVKVTGNYTINTQPGKLTIAPAPLTITGVIDEAEYNSTTQSLSGYTVTGLVSDHAIVPGSVTAYGEGLKAGWYDVTVDASNIAIRDQNGTGAVIDSKNYDISTFNGKLCIWVREEEDDTYEWDLVITAGSKTVPYDGNEHLVDSFSFTIAGSEEHPVIGTPDDYTLFGVSVHEARTNAGESVTRVVIDEENYHIIDRNGVDMTFYFAKPTLETGKLTVTPRKLTVQAGDATRAYTGSEITVTTDVKLISGELANGHTLTATASGSGTSAGEHDITVADCMIVNEEISKNYDITAINGTLTITPLELTLQADDATRTYTGREITAITNVNLTAGSLVDGHNLTATASGAGTDVQEDPYDIAVDQYQVHDADGKDVTRNYKITTVGGKLTITPVALTIKPDDATRTHTGSLITVSTNVNITAGRLVDGSHTLTAISSGTGTAVGSYDITIDTATIKITGTGGADVSKNYSITPQPGILTIVADNGSGNNGGSSGGGSSGGSGNGSSNLRTPAGNWDLTTIEDGDVPLAALPTPGDDGLTTIEDEDTPLGGLPEAGGIPIESIVALGVLLIGTGSLIKVVDRKDLKDFTSLARDKDA